MIGNEIGSTPIHSAAYNGHFDILEFLCDFNEIPNAPNNRGDTPLHMAAYNGHLQIVKWLVERRQASLTLNGIGGSTAIHAAAYNGHLEIVKFLMHFSETPNAPNNFGRTPSELARDQQFFEIAELLEK